MELDFDRVRHIWNAWYDGRDAVLAPGRDPGESLEHYITRECVPVLIHKYYRPDVVYVNWGTDE